MMTITREGLKGEDEAKLTVVQDFLLSTARLLVDHPEDIEIQRIVSFRKVQFVVYCHQNDQGQIIGQGGGIISALHKLMVSIACRQKTNIYFEVTLAIES